VIAVPTPPIVAALPMLADSSPTGNSTAAGDTVSSRPPAATPCAPVCCEELLCLCESHACQSEAQVDGLGPWQHNGAQEGAALVTRLNLNLNLQEGRRGVGDSL
jgi:hypothetical protein